MKRLLTIVVAALALSACLLMTSCGSSATNADNAITVSATGTAKITPDKANIGISVLAHGTTAEEARSNAMRIAQDVKARLKTAGASDELVAIAEGEIVPVYGGIVEDQVMNGYYDYDGNWIEEPETVYYDLSDQVVGYDTTAIVTAGQVEVSALSTMLKECVAAGATGFGNFTYYVSDREAAYQEALAAAVDAAYAKAEALADASGVYVGRVVNMVEQSDPSALVLEVAGDTTGFNVQDTATLNVDPAPIAATASVTVSYAIS